MPIGTNKNKCPNDASTFTHAHAQQKKNSNLLNKQALNNAQTLTRLALEMQRSNADVSYALLRSQHPLSLSLKHFHSSTLTLHLSTLLTSKTITFTTTLSLPLLLQLYLLSDFLRVYKIVTCINDVSSQLILS